MAKQKIKMDLGTQEVVEAHIEPKSVGPICKDCAYLQVDQGRDAVIGTQLVAKKLYPCFRYPRMVLKCLNEFCGEFKSR